MSADIPSREGLAEYDVTWPWHGHPQDRLPPGLTCVFRVRNEARNLPWVLPPILEAVQRVVLVDNLSDDDTAAVGQRVAEECGAADRYLGTSYPFAVSRAGAEHRETPADSVHSLTHFYNWSFSHVRTSYSMKWDGDMVLTPEGVSTLADLSWQLEDTEAVVVVPRHPLTVVDEQTAYLDVGKSFLEPWIYPMGPDFTFVKAFEWEVREWPERCQRIVLPEGLAVELKWLDADEFSHWTDVEDFGARAPRKRREWEIDRAIREGRAEEIEGLVRIVAPEGVHVVDHVTRTWLPQASRPLAETSGAGVRSRRPRVVAPGPALDPLHVLDDTIEPILAMVHPDCADIVTRLPASTRVHVLPVDELPTPQPGWGTVLVVAPDRDAFQRMVPTLPRVRGARCYALALEWSHEAAGLAQRGDWPVIHRVVSRRRESEYVQLVRFATPTNPRQVFAEWARLAVGRSLQPHAGLRVGLHGPVLAPPGDVLAIRYGADGAEESERDVPPDIVLSAAAEAPEIAEHHVIARAPVLLDTSSGPLAIGPLDQRILNPMGFDRTAALEPGVLAVTDEGVPLLRVDDAELASTPARGATEQMMRAARPQAGVTVEWPAEEDLGLARTVAGLAMTGTPLVTEAVPPWAAALLGDPVSTALVAPVDLANELAREEHSIVLRRAALREFSVPAWRSRVARVARLRPPYRAPVSVVMATKRADLLEHAVAQVARQRGVDLELVFAPHGFTPDPARVAELAGPGVTTQVLPQGADVMFGDVLEAAAEAASGDIVLKMDDDDWYGPDFVADLLLARDYSGAEIVGMPAEYLYLEPLDVTVRRNDASENWGRFVAGGTMMLDRALLREVGGFRPVHRFVDASLLGDVLGAGGRVYRTQGLGYLFRRTDAGHTWQADLDFFLDPARLRERWDGFHPSRLLETPRPDLGS